MSKGSLILGVTAAAFLGVALSTCGDNRTEEQKIADAAAGFLALDDQEIPSPSVIEECTEDQGVESPCFINGSLEHGDYRQSVIVSSPSREVTMAASCAVTTSTMGYTDEIFNRTGVHITFKDMVYRIAYNEGQGSEGTTVIETPSVSLELEGDQTGRILGNSRTAQLYRAIENKCVFKG